MGLNPKRNALMSQNKRAKKCPRQNAKRSQRRVANRFQNNPARVFPRRSAPKFPRKFALDTILDKNNKFLCEKDSSQNYSCHNFILALFISKSLLQLHY